MDNGIEGMNRLEGSTVLDVTEANQETVDKFKELLKELVSEYISTTPIKEPEIQYDEKFEGELIVVYAFDSRNFENVENRNIFGEMYSIKTGDELLRIFINIARKKTDPNTIKLRE